MGQITATRNLVATKVVRLAGQLSHPINFGTYCFWSGYAAAEDELTFQLSGKTPGTVPFKLWNKKNAKIFFGEKCVQNSNRFSQV